jgi:predicted phosphate transport protein (TIGR00153 family)
MGLDNIIKMFLPKDRIFYSLFEEVATRIETMGQIFSNALNNSNLAERTELLRSMEKYEHENDLTTHKIFVELGRNFITPFDRDDIHYLATALDDIADYIDSSSKKILLYNVTEIDESMRKLSDFIRQATSDLKGGLLELRNMKNLRLITEACVKINSLENRADDLFENYLTNLFETEKDVVKIIKLKEIMQGMEIVTDKCEDAANVMETIIVKYA